MQLEIGQKVRFSGKAATQLGVDPKGTHIVSNLFPVPDDYERSVGHPQWVQIDGAVVRLYSGARFVAVA